VFSSPPFLARGKPSDAMDATSYGFTVEWFDKQADMIREYTLTVYQQPKGPLEVAMFDPKTHRSFLKRMEIPGLAVEDFRIGGIVTVHARQLKVTKYNDGRTKQALEGLHGGVCLLTVPSMFQQVGHLLERIESCGLRISRLRLVNDNGPVVALQVVGGEADSRWASIAASLPSDCVQKVAPSDLEHYFNRGNFPTTAAFDNCALCLVRPHAVRDGGTGMVIRAVMEAGLEVSALEMVHFERAQSVEFHDVYKGVLPYYNDLVDGMRSGPCVALEVRAASNVTERLRDVCGPHDVDMARHLRQYSLRARLGKDNANNGVHATDLEDDGEREVSYVFDTLFGGK